jgi:hypothetical protein
MLCSIDDYLLADGTLAGGYAIKDLRLQIRRIFDVVIPLPEILDSGTLETGRAYKIILYESGDDFTNVGGTNATGNVFIATAATPANWTNLSTLEGLSPVLLDRDKRKVDITFSVQRVQSTITAADIFILDHEITVPRTGDVKLLATTSMAIPAGVTALIVNGKLISNELVRQYGKETEHSYHVVGSLLFAPTPEEDHLVTEGGDRITTEGGDSLVIE